jgi:hypothetical protein
MQIRIVPDANALIERACRSFGVDDGGDVVVLANGRRPTC